MPDARQDRFDDGQKCEAMIERKAVSALQANIIAKSELAVRGGNANAVLPASRDETVPLYELFKRQQSIVAICNVCVNCPCPCPSIGEQFIAT